MRAGFIQRLGPTPILVGFGLMALLALSALSSLVVAQELPVFRQGMWEFQRMVGSQKMTTKNCTNPSEDMKRQNTMIEKAGCRFSPMKKAGNTYTFTADCKMKSPPGGSLESHTTTVMTVESDSAYKLQVDGTTNGQSTKETLMARRVGDCKN